MEKPEIKKEDVKNENDKKTELEQMRETISNMKEDMAKMAETNQKILNDYNTALLKNNELRDKMDKINEARIRAADFGYSDVKEEKITKDNIYDYINDEIKKAFTESYLENHPDKKTLNFDFDDALNYEHIDLNSLKNKQANEEYENYITNKRILEKNKEIN